MEQLLIGLCLCALALAIYLWGYADGRGVTFHHLYHIWRDNRRAKGLPWPDDFDHIALLHKLNAAPTAAEAQRIFNEAIRKRDNPT